MKSRRYAVPLLMLATVSLLASCGGGSEEPKLVAQGTTTRATAQGVTAAQAATAVWSAQITLPLVPVTGAVLASGKLLFLAADAPNNILYAGGGHTYASVFDPKTNTATIANVTSSGQDAFCVGTARLADGRLLVNGGDNAGLSSLYDPATDTWSAAGTMNTTRGYNASVPLADGSVLTVGGSWSGGQGAKSSEVWTAAGGWRALPGLSTSDTTLTTADQSGWYRNDNHMWLIPTANGKVLHAGPSTQMHWLDATGNGSVVAAGPRADDTDSMNGTAVMYDAGKILTVGGAVNYDNTDSKSGAFIIDTTQGTALARRISSMAYPRLFHNSVVLPNGQVVVMGGQTHGVGFSDANGVLTPELFDPQSETFTALPAMSVARNYHSIGLLLPDGRVVSAGGGLCNCAGDHQDLQILSPPYLFNGDGSAATRPVITAAPALASYGDAVTVSTDSAVTSFAIVRLGAATHTVNNDQRRLPLQFTSNGTTNSYTVTLPTNPGLLMPGQWLLFAMNAQGTPSVATILTVSGNGAPILSNPGDVTVSAGGAVSVAMSASSASGTLTYSASNLPSGLSINASTGAITGIAAGASRQVATVTVTNGLHTTSTNVLFNVNPVQGLLSQYYANTGFAVAPYSAAVESPDVTWPAGTGALSVMWMGWVQAPATGSIQLQAKTTQGVRVWFNNQFVIDTMSSNSTASDTVTLNVAAGQMYRVVIQTVKPSGAGSIAFNWQLPGGAMVPVPPERLFPSSVPSLKNIAVGQPATQSTTANSGTAASRAVDGNVDGSAWDGSIAITTNSSQPWWQLDLGQTSRVDLVRLWNRTDCCGDQLQNFVVFLSASDMTGRTLGDLSADPTVIARSVGALNANPMFDVPFGAVGRYVRIQLTGTSNTLALGEVQVFGAAGGLPALTLPQTQQGAVGAGSQLNVGATDAFNSPISYSASGLPAGLTINAATGAITGTPTAPGTYSTTISATDGYGLTGSGTVSWTVLDVVPSVISLPVPVGASGAVLSYNPAIGSGAPSQFSWNFGDGTAATAASTSAQASHAYTAPGVYTVTLTVTTTDGRSRAQSAMQAIYPAGTSALANASTNIMVERRSNASSRVWVVNPDNDTVSVFDAVSYAKLAEIPVGSGPRTLALSGYGPVWVTNHDGASISIIDTGSLTVTSTMALARGSQPYGIVFSPADGSAFITLEATGQLVRYASGVSTVMDVGPNPRHLSISAAGDRILLSRFITRPLPGEGTATVSTTDTNGNKRGGEVLVINPATLAVTSTVVLAHSEKVDAENQGRGIPNYLGAAAISPDGKSAWVPSKQDNIKRGTLRDGNPLNFQSTVRSISSRIDLTALAEDYSGRVDHDNTGVASAAVYHPTGAYLFVALETNRQVAVLDAAGKRELFRFDVGYAPQGVAVSTDGLTLYVNNLTSRSVSIIDLTPLMGFGKTAVNTLATPGTVANDKLSAQVLRGKQLFYDARDTRLARDSYMSCASCHTDGGFDGRTWDFTSTGEGLRNTIALKGRAGMGQGFLHWSANFDEVQDFEGQIRALAGGTGLMSDADFNTGTRSQPLGDKKAGISPDLDALAAYLGSLSTMAPSPFRNADGSMSAAAQAGKTVFQSAGCASCHGGTGFTNSGNLTQVQNIGTIKATSGNRLGGPLTGIDIPTLRDVWATAPYLHDGSAPALADAVRAHNNLRLSAADIASVSAYLREIGNDEPAPAASVAPAYTACGTEGSTCTLPPGATGTVTFGVNGNYVRQSGISGAIACSAATFGDPAPGVAKNCSFVVDTPAVTPVGAQYCAPQGGNCTLPAGATATAYFGVGSSWVTKKGVTGAFACTAAGFGSDPAPAATKACSYQITAQTSGSSTGLVGQYFANGSLQGAPVLTRVEAPWFSWGTGSPAANLPANGFSARWTGTLIAPAAGLAQLQAVADDGVRVWVNNKLVIDAWTVHVTTAYTAPLSLTAGQRASIVIEYFESVDNATLQLNWMPTGTTAAVAVPANALLPGMPVSTQNIALGKTATQSTTLSGEAASRAVDGNVNGDAWANSMSGTTSEAQPWWQVDLGTASRIDLIQLWNRLDCCNDRLQNFSVFVSPTDMTGRTLAQLAADTTVTVRQVAATSWGAASMGIPINGYGRYVRVQLSGTTELSLGEVQVYGSSNGNLAQGKSATQSSSAFGGDAARAVDGTTDGAWGNNSVTHTDNVVTQPWWQVDLGGQGRIDGITLWNRTDCCASRLHSFTVFVSATDMSGKTMAQLLADSTVKAVVYNSADVLPNLNIPISGTLGRYVRVQLNGQDYLSLAEVQVFGSLGGN